MCISGDFAGLSVFKSFHEHEQSRYVDAYVPISGGRNPALNEAFQDMRLVAVPVSCSDDVTCRLSSPKP